MTHIKEKDKAPDIKSVDQNGNEFSLSDYKGKKVILYFYPKDNTPGCTAQACNLRDNYELLKEKGFEVFGISPDTEKSHHRFIERHDLPFSLIMDEDKKIMEDYGVWGEKKMYGKSFMGVNRTTFIIDEKGKIEKVFKKVNTKAHVEQILAEYE
ncbi:MAG: thioredoxin-dependent thiol peroxidase [Bacteroidales bacterium]|nr:thioredoxin-dependent thiol peroxidase [Bacteroidales bacterium]MCF8458055.1 thioredoxin-dependent thiol peroxidase [Bacteroidales bacterium]